MEWETKKPLDVVRYFFLAIVGLLANVSFWYWWLHQEINSPLLFTLFSLALFYEGTFLTLVSYFFAWFIKVPPEKKARNGLRVAVITLTVPGSESKKTVEKQLQAISTIDYPHDSFLLVDRCHTPEYIDLCKGFKTTYFSRHDEESWGARLINRWNQKGPPFQAKSKAGNVNAWLDVFHNKYDFFVQLDVDHIPIPEYLDVTLGYFDDPKVGYVQAPSLYGNQSASWVAHGALEQEAVLQGPLQMGFFGATSTPYIIGSHCTYRMSAIMEIGGFQPTRAEDHLDTVYLQAHGYRGVYTPRIIALGDAPETIETYLGQQFAWAYSIVEVLLYHSPSMLKRTDCLKTLQFLYSQTWYPLWSMSLAILYLTPILCLTFNSTLSTSASFLSFTAYYAPVLGSNILVYLWHKQFFPMNLNTVTWRQLLLMLCRWPIVLSAIVQCLFRVEKPYMITQKGTSKGVSRVFSLKTQSVYIALVLLNTMGVLLLSRSSLLIWAALALWASIFFIMFYGIALILDIKLIRSEGALFRSIIKTRIASIAVGLFMLAVFAAPLVKVIKDFQARPQHLKQFLSSVQTKK